MAKDTPLFNLEDNKFQYGFNILGVQINENTVNNVYTESTVYTPLLDVFEGMFRVMVGQINYTKSGKQAAI